MSLVTVLILTYNVEEWIEESLKSVMEQTYSDLQILIIDDGSTDKTSEKILSFNDQRIELFKKSHTGLPNSFNYSIDKIKGDYVARLDADDFCDKERISKQLKFLKENDSYSIVGSNFTLINKDGNQIEKIRNPEKHEDIIEQLPRRCCIWVGSTLMKKDIILQLNGYNEKYKSANDWDFFLRAIGLTDFYNIQEYLSYKRYHPGNISLNEKSLKETEDILLTYNNSIVQSSDKEMVVGKAYFNIGYHYYYENKFIEANKYFDKAFGKNKELQVIRYYIFSKYFNWLIRFSRKYKFYKLFDWIRYFDNANKFFRSKF